MQMNQKGYKKLEVWRRADQLAHAVYKATHGFPKYELFGLTSQLRRSALSIPTNIAEASGRQHRNESKQFANIALGSLAETEYLLEFTYVQGYMSKDNFELLEQMRCKLGGILWNFYQSF